MVNEKETAMTELEETAQALYEMGKIEQPTMDRAAAYCRTSKMGEHKCSVKTRYGWCCDICLECELMRLRLHGVHTVNSCCGHGNPALATIVVVSDESYEKMMELEYELLKMPQDRVSWWRPKSRLIYGDADELGGDQDG